MSEGRFYWLKLDRGFFKRHDTRIIEHMPNGKDYLLFYLKLLCEAVDHDGNLRFSDQIPYNEEMLSTITDTNIDIVRSAVQIFTSLGMMEIFDDGTLYMSAVKRMTDSCADNPNANRQRRFRERKKESELPLLSASVMENNASVTKDNESKSKSKNKSKSTEKDIFKAYADGEFYELLKEFEQMRVKKHKPMTDRAKQMLLTKLDSMPEAQRAQALQEAIYHAWDSVYLPKGETPVKGNTEPVTQDETDRLLRLTKEMQEC